MNNHPFSKYVLSIIVAIVYFLVLDLGSAFAFAFFGAYLGFLAIASATLLLTLFLTPLNVISTVFL
jgi:hypothetical protein